VKSKVCKGPCDERKPIKEFSLYWATNKQMQYTFCDDCRSARRKIAPSTKTSKLRREKPWTREEKKRLYTCSKCGTTDLPYTLFRNRTIKKCNDCQNEDQHEWYHSEKGVDYLERTKEDRAEKGLNYYHENREKVNKYGLELANKQCAELADSYVCSRLARNFQCKRSELHEIEELEILISNKRSMLNLHRLLKESQR
jgi:hypothetical protein